MTPFLLTTLAVSVALCAGFWIGYAIARATGRVVLAPIAPDAGLLAEAREKGRQAGLLEGKYGMADATAASYTAGVRDERARHKAARSAAGTKAAATRRNRVTGQERPVTVPTDAEGAE